jgi:hypothetical protein
VSSALDILNGGLDAGKATIGYLDGPGGFHLATSEGDAEFFAARRGAGTVLRVDISGDAGNALRSAGASMRSIPRGPKSPFTTTTATTTPPPPVTSPPTLSSSPQHPIRPQPHIRDRPTRTRTRQKRRRNRCRAPRSVLDHRLEWLPYGGWRSPSDGAIPVTGGRGVRGDSHGGQLSQPTASRGRRTFVEGSADP